MTKISLCLILLFLTWDATATEISVTMDDFNVNESTHISPRERNQKILDAFNKHKIKGALFVVGKFVQSQEGKQLLDKWDQAGHLIGNHTFRHARFGSGTSIDEFSNEVIQCQFLLQSYTGFRKIFRFPTLTEGESREKRDQFRKWLGDQGYQNGHVTIDASDWYIDQRLREKLRTHPNVDLSHYRDFYLQHVWERAQYYNELSKKVLGHEVKHTLLTHFNLLNALFVDDLLTHFKKQSWKVIDASEAFSDPTFKRNPDSMPSGQSLIWALAKESGKFDSELRYPGEDGTYEMEKMDSLGL